MHTDDHRSRQVCIKIHHVCVFKIYSMCSCVLRVYMRCGGESTSTENAEQIFVDPIPFDDSWTVPMQTAALAVYLREFVVPLVYEQKEPSSQHFRSIVQDWIESRYTPMMETTAGEKHSTHPFLTAKTPPEFDTDGWVIGKHV